MTKTKPAQALLKEELKNPAFKKAHASQPAISRLESGSYTNVSMAFLRKVGAVLGATPVVHFKTS